MSRERDRIAKKREKNPIEECNKIQKRFYPELFSKFGQIKDPRNSSYITYSTKEMLGSLYYKGIAGISSMRAMTEAFNNEQVTRNLYQFMDGKEKEYLPHGVTLNEFLERVNPAELEEIQRDIAYQMIRRKTFDDAKILGKWRILVDGSELDEGKQQKNEKYLSRTYNKGEDSEFTKYHRSVLEAKLYLGNNLVCSIATETIENSEEYNEKKMTDEQVKQDCESKAFVRLAAKIKKAFPRLAICIVADGLYVSSTVLGICKKNGWDYIIRYKEGSAPSIAEEYRSLPEREKAGSDTGYANGIVFNEYEVNLIHYTERKIVDGEEKTTEFAWITSIWITEKNAGKIVRGGRSRWKIENQGFNRQKHWQGDIEHACSWNEKAQKNHYLLEQISDLMKQLYEYFFLDKNGIKKTKKNISSELLASFGRQLTETEDIPAQLNESALD